MPQDTGALAKKLKTALSETRLLILGAQILFGFQFAGVFQDRFDDIHQSAKILDAMGLLLMVITVALMIAPSMQHRIVEHGHTTARILRATTRLASIALLPFAASLGIDVYVVITVLFGTMFAAIAAAVFVALALTFWYGLEYLYKQTVEETRMPASSEPPQGKTPLSTRIEEMLTEARVVLPGAQALLGFQLAVTMSRSFAQLPVSSRLVHAAALMLVALSVILLVAPAAFHRIAFGGEDSEAFHRIGSRLVVIATVPLAGGIAGDVYVALGKITESMVASVSAAGFVTVVMLALWYAQPLLLRQRMTASNILEKAHG